MTDDRRCFVDTNILLASTDESRRHHSAARTFLDAGIVGEQRLFGSGQIFREYLVVATRPVDANGLGLTAGEALENIREFWSCIQLLEENADVSEQLLALVQEYDLKGKRIHDANIVATMRAHGLSRIKTINTGDFFGFKGLQVEAF